MLFDEFKKITKGKTMWPIALNTSALFYSSGWSTKEFLEKYYKRITPVDMILVMKENFGMTLFNESWIKDIHSEAFEEYILKSKKFQSRIRLFKKLRKKVEEIYNKQTKEFIDKESMEDFPVILREVRDLMWDLNGVVLFSTMQVDKKLIKEEVKRIKWGISEENINAIWEMATMPIFDSFDKAQRIHFLELIASGKKLEEIVEECQYFTASYFDAKDLNETSKYLKNVYGKLSNQKNAKKKLILMQKEKQKKLERYEQWYKSLDVKEKKLVKYIQAIMELRDERKNIFNKGITVWFRMYRRIFRELGMDASLIPFLSYEEARGGIGKIRKIGKDLAKRKNGYAMLLRYSGKSSYEIVSFEKYKKLFQYYYKSSLIKKGEIISEIKGQVANKGKVQGIARVIIDPKKFTVFNRGDILVTVATRPDFVPLMKFASAIITEEGGITSHAAIVSRELGKPCIIGTKIATQFLKDGDLVEVDANKGIVRINKKTKK